MPQYWIKPQPKKVCKTCGQPGGFVRDVCGKCNLNPRRREQRKLDKLRKLVDSSELLPPERSEDTCASAKQESTSSSGKSSCD